MLAVAVDFDPGVTEGEATKSEESAVGGFLAAQTEDTFAGLVRECSPRLLRYFRCRGCIDSVAEELSQDVLFTVYRQVHALREPALFRPWMYKIAQNAILQHRRKLLRRVPTVQVDEVDEQAFAPRSHSFAHSRAGGQFADWMEWLEAPERQVVTLRYVDDLEYHEIAAALGIPIGTVKWRLFRAKAKLMVRFKERR